MVSNVGWYRRGRVRWRPWFAPSLGCLRPATSWHADLPSMAPMSGLPPSCNQGPAGLDISSQYLHQLWARALSADVPSCRQPPNKRLEPTRRERIEMGRLSSAPRGSGAIR